MTLIMNLMRLSFPLFSALLLAMGGLAPAQDQEPAASGPASLQDTAKLFPMGKPWEQVRIPRHNEKDELTNMIHSETLTRESEELMKMEGVTVVFLQPDGTLNMRIKTAEGFYNIKTEKIRSRTKTYVEHPKFDMHGDSSEFDVKTQTGVLNGRVQMVIYEVEAETAPVPALISPDSHAASENVPSSEEDPQPEVK